MIDGPPSSNGKVSGVSEDRVPTVATHIARLWEGQRSPTKEPRPVAKLNVAKSTVETHGKRPCSGCTADSIWRAWTFTFTSIRVALARYLRLTSKEWNLATLSTNRKGTVGF